MVESIQNEAVVSALIGLAGACNNNPKTPRTDRLLLEALIGEQDAEAVRAEKFAVAPDCAVCANPCGNTSDYDLQHLYNADAAVREAKLRILAVLREAAAILLHQQQTEIDLFYKALLYVGSDLDADTLCTLLEELQAFLQRIEGNRRV
ncbi:MAG: hypothetical protein J1E00_00800 [Oscillospiraceae bacterium]|nr:hypothetical protein [Oscillospiraceae bacterium]